MRRVLSLLCLIAVAALSPWTLRAESNGINGYSTGSGCNSCHSGGSGSTTASVTSGSGTFTVNVGGTLNLTATVAHSSLNSAGFNASVKNSGNSNVGSFTAGSGTTVENGEITHSTPKALSGGSTSWDFSWTAPSTAGSYTLSINGNAVNGSGNTSGDRPTSSAQTYTVTVSATPALSVTAPTSSASICRGSSTNITWSATAVTNINIQYSSNGGSNWNDIATNVAANSSPYSWGIPASATVGSNYRVRIVDASNASLSSTTGDFSVVGAPTITTQPTSKTVCENSQTTFTVAASGSGLTYQWRRNGTNITGATSATYNFTATNATAGTYDVVVTGCSEGVTSQQATLTVNAVATITTQPVAQTVCVGQPVTFTVVASGGTSLTYQWYRDGNLIPNATSATYTFTPTAADAGNYSVFVTAACPVPAISNNAKLTLNPAAAITSQPQGVSIAVGATLNLSVTATGTGLTYQWRKNGTNIAGATTATYTKTNVTNADAGGYDVIVGSPCGNMGSQVATVIITGGAPQPLLAFRRATVEFGARAGGTTVHDTLWLRNAGNALGTVTGVSLSGTSPFTISSPTSFTVAAGDSARVIVSFAVPTTGTTFASTLTVTADGPAVGAVAVTGSRSDDPSPELSFGVEIVNATIEMAQTEVSVPITLSNNGTVAVTLMGASISGDPAFTITAQPEVNAQLLPSQSANYMIRYASEAAGQHNAQLDVMFMVGANHMTISVPLSGTAAGPNGVEEDFPVNARLYPNPAQSELRLDLEGLIEARIMDMNGALVRELSAGADGARWDLMDARGRRVAAGSYLLQVRTAAGWSMRPVIVLP